MGRAGLEPRSAAAPRPARGGPPAAGPAPQPRPQRPRPALTRRSGAALPVPSCPRGERLGRALRASRPVPLAPGTAALPDAPVSGNRRPPEPQIRKTTTRGRLQTPDPREDEGGAPPGPGVSRTDLLDAACHGSSGPRALAAAVRRAQVPRAPRLSSALRLARLLPK